jgi:hypothetical protein
MRLLPWVLSFVFPLCGTVGAQGVPDPGAMDLAHFERAPHSAAVIGPAGFADADFVAPAFAAAPGVVFAALRAVAAGQARTYPLAVEPGALQAAYVARSAGGNFPDVVQVAAVPAGAGRSSYVIYSHSIYGASDFGVNAARVKAWAASVEEKMGEAK